MRRKVNPDSPYLGMRGGWKGGGRPKKEPVENEDRRICVRLPYTHYMRIIHSGMKMSDYIRGLVEADFAKQDASKSEQGGER